MKILGSGRVLDSIETVQVRDVGRHAREYLNADSPGIVCCWKWGSRFSKTIMAGIWCTPCG